MLNELSSARKLTVAEYLALREFNKVCSALKGSYIMGKEGTFMIRLKTVQNMTPIQLTQFCKALDKLYGLPYYKIMIPEGRTTGNNDRDRLMLHFLLLGGVAGADCDRIKDAEEIIFQMYSPQRVLREKTVVSVNDQEMQFALPTETKRQADESVYTEQTKRGKGRPFGSKDSMQRVRSVRRIKKVDKKNVKLM